MSFFTPFYRWSRLPRLPLEEISLRKRRLIVLCVLALSVIVSLSGSFLLRFDFTIPPVERSHLLTGLVLFLAIKLGVFHLFLVHRGWWTAVGLVDLGRLLAASVFASILSTATTIIVIGPAFPRSVYVIDFFLNGLAISTVRILLRVYRELPRRMSNARQNRKAVLIYGAGWAGSGLLREIWANPNLGLRVAGFIDDSEMKNGDSVHGVPVLGLGDDISRVIAQLRHRKINIEEILIAMPSATGRQMRNAIGHCRTAGVQCKTLPGIGELLTSKGLSKQIREISVEDLLSREPVHLEEGEIRKSLSGQAVMITGAAGSIGAELSRQIASFGPRVLILLDRAESDLFRIDLELRTKYPSLPVTAEVCDICDQERVEDIIRHHRVDCIFHAAAYKHVPLMELHPLEAARNNVLGTWMLACTAYDNRVKRFVLISSDKAVNPTNVMGATKRVAEMLVSCFPTPAEGQEGTRFVSVRFGNVLASNGSVVPIFQRQIAIGGPVTVTHPEVQRYFMTIREAVQLVLQASTMSHGGDIFVLDMGEPVKIVDLARNMIRLAGFVPDDDVEIRFVGLRPGEKLFEELITRGEHILPTRHEKIKIFQGHPVDSRMIDTWIAKLRILMAHREEVSVIHHLAALVPEYQVSAYWQQPARKQRKPASTIQLIEHPKKLSQRAV